MTIYQQQLISGKSRLSRAWLDIKAAARAFVRARANCILSESWPSVGGRLVLMVAATASTLAAAAEPIQQQASVQPVGSTPRPLLSVRIGLERGDGQPAVGGAVIQCYIYRCGFRLVTEVVDAFRMHTPGQYEGCIIAPPPGSALVLQVSFASGGNRTVGPFAVESGVPRLDCGTVNVGLEGSISVKSSMSMQAQPFDALIVPCSWSINLGDAAHLCRVDGRSECAVRDLLPGVYAVCWVRQGSGWPLVQRVRLGDGAHPCFTPPDDAVQGAGLLTSLVVDQNGKPLVRRNLEWIMTPLQVINGPGDGSKLSLGEVLVVTGKDRDVLSGQFELDAYGRASWEVPTGVYKLLIIGESAVGGTDQLVCIAAGMETTITVWTAEPSER